METKKLLKIAYAIAKFQDFVTEDFKVDEIEELDLDFTPTEQEIKEVIKLYGGWGMDYLDNEIRGIYFSEESEPKITRFEFITDKGREVVEYGEFTYSIQDDGRTLKVFKENKTNK